MKLIKIIFVLPLLLLAALASSAPDEAMGRVSKVVDGDTFDVTLQDYNSSQVSEDVIRIRLADIDTPETRGPKASEAGKNASAYTRAWLLSIYIFLDLDDKTGKDEYGRWVAVCYLSKDGKPDKNFNKKLVDAGHAVIKDFKNNEFDPQSCLEEQNLGAFPIHFQELGFSTHDLNRD
jgi:micrococcal nuclease